MFTAVTGNMLRTQLMVWLTVNEMFYVSQVAQRFGRAKSGVQRMVDNLEAEGLVRGERLGNVRIYHFNERYPFLEEVKSLFKKMYESMPEENKIDWFVLRKRARSRGKPIAFQDERLSAVLDTERP